MANPGRRTKNTRVLDTLLEKADVQGYLTTDDLIEVVPAACKDAERLESVLMALRRRGVDVLDEEQIGAVEEEDDVDFNDLDPYSNLVPVASEDTIGLYLKEMARVPLLSMDEELKIAICIEKGCEARNQLKKLNGNGTPAQKCELEQMVEAGLLAREHLIKANTRLVVSIAKRYTTRGVPFLDLIQEGNLGLMKAVEKFEYQRGFRFSTYATWWIRQTITRAIADQARTIRVPVHMVDRIRQMYRLTHEMEQTLGRPPTNDELAVKLELPLNKVEWMLRVSWLPLSLESPVNDEDEESELGMFIEDQLTPSPVQSTYAKLLVEKIEEVLESLPPREARILRLRYGLENGRTYTLEEVGQKFGLTRERIRQIETKAMRRLRHPRRARQLREYL